ncbi:Meiosis arrest female protein [Melia azedarach]|uniref:Meiosis arrest female protein n=1 Tax=Melia azedarach TaxID=155640 RepID=A0ACC1XMW1_MELAZ|nr:Meiosis arrest female protein [Melia azedarach]
MAATFKGFSLMFAMAVFSAIVLSASAQDFAAPAPSPAQDTGAAYSAGVSGAVICSSLLLSALAFLKH